MLRFLLFAVVVWMSAGRVVGQDWATVRMGDTAYFMGGQRGHFGGSGSCDWNGAFNLLRIQYVDSAQSIGLDSAFYFPRGLRGQMQAGCIDTAAASWLGYRAIRTSAGVELYFNSVGDTITMRNQAMLGDSWTLAKDTSNRTFRATIVSADVDTVDGVLDSVKTASIQAYSGTTPVAHPYNTRVLQWSKSREWTMPLDFYLFPQLPSSNLSAVLGSPYDSSQMRRLDWVEIKRGLARVNLVRIFQPGNESIWVQTFGVQFGTPGIQTTTHDSVISFQSIDSVRALVTFRTVKLVWQRTAPTGPPYQPIITTTLTTSVHTDTVSAFAAQSSVEQRPLPEVKTPFLSMGSLPYYNLLAKPRFGIRPFCDGYLISDNLSSVGGFIFTSCWVQSAGPDMWARCSTFFPGAGLMHSLYPAAIQGFFHEGGTHYLKIGNCEFGTKIDVEAMDIDDAYPAKAQPAVLSPNPATGITRVLNLPAAQHQIILRDATGRTLQSFQNTGPTADLPTASLPNGVYFVEVSNATGRTTLKLQVMH